MASTSARVNGRSVESFAEDVADARRRRQQRQADQRDGPAFDGAAPRSHASDATIGRCEI